MAVAVPIVGAFMAVDAGIAAIGAATTALGTFAAFAEVAGGILLGVGALTGKINFLSLITPMLTFAGLSIAKDMPA